MKDLKELQHSFTRTFDFTVVFEYVNGVSISGTREPKSEACDRIDKGETHPEDGHEYCQFSDSLGAKEATRRKKPYLFECWAGFSNFAIPIIVGEEVIALLFGGQFYAEKPKTEVEGTLYKNLCSDLGIPTNDLDKFHCDPQDPRNTEEKILEHYEAKDGLYKQIDRKNKIRISDEELNRIEEISKNEGKRRMLSPEKVVLGIRALSDVAKVISDAGEAVLTSRRKSECIIENTKKRIKNIQDVLGIHLKLNRELTEKQKRLVHNELYEISNLSAQVIGSPIQESRTEDTIHQSLISIYKSLINSTIRKDRQLYYGSRFLLLQSVSKNFVNRISELEEKFESIKREDTTSESGKLDEYSNIFKKLSEDYREMSRIISDRWHLGLVKWIGIAGAILSFIVFYLKVIL